MAALCNTTTGTSSWSANLDTIAELQCDRGRYCKLYTHWIVCRLSCGRGSDAVRGLVVDCAVDVPSDTSRDPSSTDDCLEGLG